MSECSLLRYLYLAYLSQPPSERLLYRGLRRWRSRAIVELGIGAAVRTRRLLEVAKRYCAQQPLRYTAIDLFESRPPDQQGLSLKGAHQQLQLDGVRVQLAPGDPWTGLQRLANTLVGTDLLIVSANVDPESLARSWFFVPRMLDERSRVFRESRSAAGTTKLQALTLTEIQQLAAAQQKARRNAA